MKEIDAEQATGTRQREERTKVSRTTLLLQRNTDSIQYINRTRRLYTKNTRQVYAIQRPAAGNWDLVIVVYGTRSVVEKHHGLGHRQTVLGVSGNQHPTTYYTVTTSPFLPSCVEIWTEN